MSHKDLLSTVDLPAGKKPNLKKAKNIPQKKAKPNPKGSPKSKSK